MVFHQLPFRIAKHLLYFKQTTCNKFHGVYVLLKISSGWHSSVGATDYPASVSARRLLGSKRKNPVLFEIICHPHGAESVLQGVFPVADLFQLVRHSAGKTSCSSPVALDTTLRT